MRQQVSKNKKLQKEIDQVRNPHNPDSHPEAKLHVHFKDGTAIHQDGSIHDKMNGTPNPSQYVWDRLHENGWCMNGLK